MSATPLKGLRVLEFTHTVMGPTAGLIVQFDYNNDNVIDGAATVTDTGTYEFQPSGLAFATHTIRARIKEHDAQGVAQYGAWSSLQFTLLDPAQATKRIDSLVLASDTGNSSTDGATSDGTVSGHVANAGENGAEIEVDSNGDGTPDATMAVGSGGNFTYTPTGLTNGLVTVRARVKAADTATPARERYVLETP